MARFRRYLRLGSLFLLLAQVATRSIPPVFASEMTESVDEATLASFQANKPNYLPIEPQVLSTEVPHEAVQEFSFVEKTFRTSVGQSVLLQFTSTLEANEVLVRIPENGKIVDTQLSSDYSVTHSQGEYWLVKTNQKQTFFELPVVFETAGQNFITVDNDADHFYLEVVENSQSLEVPKTEDQLDLEETVHTLPIVGQPVLAKEENLTIPEELIKAEDERILEEITDPQDRSNRNVSNWSGFRTAWNDSGTNTITLTGGVTHTTSIWGSALNIRNSSVIINGQNNSISLTNSTTLLLEMSGTANLVINSLDLLGGNFQRPLIRHNGSGLVDANRLRTTFTGNETSIEAQNIRLRGMFLLTSTSINPAISLVRGGTLTLDPGSSYSSISSRRTVASNNTKPIVSNASSQIIINTNRLTMGTGYTTPMSSWFQVNATLTGINGSQVLSSDSDPNDFVERYTELFNERWYSALIFNASGSEWVDPPVQTGTVIATYTDQEGNELAQPESITGNIGTSYSTQKKEIDGWTLTKLPSNATGIFTQASITVEYIYERTQRRLSLQANPAIGGTPIADEETLIEQGTTTIRANPNEGYRFVSWKILSGIDARIADETAEITTFTMGSTDIVLQAIYEEEKSIVPPVDPLDPEKEVDPDNPPTLPEEQGLLSIDFVSRFSFGKQGISAQTKNYYAQPQRLLNPDGTINAAEERPNYVQISDRRDESDRHGWTLSVTQNGQFINLQKHELKGSCLQLTNQQLASVQDMGSPDLSQPAGIKLIPGEKTVLMTAKDDQGIGTWVYRFGDAASADKSVVLEVPPSSAPRASTYQTTLTWELSSVPDNQK